MKTLNGWKDLRTLKVYRVSRSKKSRIRKYARVPSSKDSTRLYNIVKVRIQGTRNYAYECQCDNWIFQRPRGGCKHIRQVKTIERRAR